MVSAPLRVRVVGRFAEDAAARGEGEVVAVVRSSAYLRFSGERYACVGDASLGRGPLNALLEDYRAPAPGERLRLDLAGAERWQPPSLPPHAAPEMGPLREAARGRAPREGLGGLVVDAHNSLSGHAQPALDALERWLVGNALDEDAAMLIGLGPGFTRAGDNYLGGVLVALRAFERAPQAQALWRWLEPRLARTSPISAAHLAAAAAGEAHASVHECLQAICGRPADWTRLLDGLSAAGWDSLAGVVAVLNLA